MDFINLSYSRFILTLFLLLATASGRTEPTIEDYGALPAVSMMAISPDGKRLAFRKHGDQVDAVVVVDLDEGEVTNGLNVSDVKPRRLYFLDDSTLILVAAEHKRFRRFRHSFDMSTAFVFDLDTGELEQLLTPGDVIKVGQSGLGQIAGVSKDRRYVYLPAFVGKPGRMADKSLMRVDLDSVRRPWVEDRGSHHTRDYFLDGDGKVLVEERFSNRAEVHSIRAHRDGEEVEIFAQETPFPQLGFVGLTPERKALVVSDENGGRTVYRAMDLADGTLSDSLFAREDADVEAPLNDINRVVHGVIYSGLRPSYEFFDPELTKRMNAILAEYPEHSVWLADWSPDWEHLLVKVEGNGSSGDYLLHSRGKPGRFLASARPNVGAGDINPILEFQYRARDGMTIPALLTVPRDKADSLNKLPAVMLPHGGPHAHDTVEFDWFAQALASRGYLVIQPQFRGSTGFGIKHWRAGRGEWGRKMQNDLTDGVRALAGEEIIDPDRVCIVGMSYGGYAALAGGAFTPELYQCVVSINGVSDLPKMLRAVKSDRGKYHWLLSYWEESMIGGENEDVDLDAVSPSNFADRFQASVLLIHGEEDRVVYFEQSKGMYRSLKRADRPVELMELEGEDHHLSQAETRLATLKAVVEFVDQHIDRAQEQ